MTTEELIRSIEADITELEWWKKAASQPVCFSCLHPRTAEQYMSECATCGTLTCGLDGCKGTCVCDLLDE